MISHRRYPSLYGEFEPLSPRSRPTRSATSTKLSSDRADWNFPYVRVFALLLIIAIIAALATQA
ncbi:MAG TPA: hypothetical protein VL069_11470 [Opitutus sp.]|nr:hypothetical protein [Opitutus sp.]